MTVSAGAGGSDGAAEAVADATAVELGALVGTGSAVAALLVTEPALPVTAGAAADVPDGAAEATTVGSVLGAVEACATVGAEEGAGAADPGSLAGKSCEPLAGSAQAQRSTHENPAAPIHMAQAPVTRALGMRRHYHGRRSRPARSTSAAVIGGHGRKARTHPVVVGSAA